MIKYLSHGDRSVLRDENLGDRSGRKLKKRDWKSAA